MSFKYYIFLTIFLLLPLSGFDVDTRPYIDVTITPLAHVNQQIIPLDRISAYNPVPRQTDSTPDISACGPNLTNQVAVSRDLIRRVLPCGTSVTIYTDRGEVIKDVVVWDTMNPRYKLTADVMLNTDDESLAYAFGTTSGYLVVNN